MIKWLVAALLLLITVNCIAQSSVSGRVIDDKTGQPISYASVKIDGINQGTITNSEGTFAFLLPANAQNNKIAISCVGYSSVKLSIASAVAAKPLVVRLKQSAAVLKDVMITTESPAEIVAHAYRNIPKNYPLNNTFYTGFYRESLWHGAVDSAEKYSYVVEAVLSLNKPSYAKTRPEGTIRVENARKSEFNNTSYFRWRAGAFTPIRFDVAKKRFDFINPSTQKRYIYTREDVTTYYDEPVYVIKFKPRKHAAYEGLLYINMRSYAIVKADYQLTADGLSDPTIYGGAPGMRTRAYKTNYQPIDGKWYLQSIWQQATGNDSKSTKYRYMTEYAATRIDTNHKVDFDYADNLQFVEILSLKPTPYSVDFWKNYNIVAETQQLKGLLIDTTMAVKQPLITAKRDSSFYIDRRKKDGYTDADLEQQQKSMTTYKDTVVVRGGKLQRARIGSQSANARSVSIGLRPIFSIPSLTIVNSKAGTLAVNYAANAGEKITNQPVALKENTVTAATGFGFELDVTRKLSIHYIGSTGYGDLKVDNSDIGFTYKHQLNSLRKRPINLLVTLDYSANRIVQKLSDYKYSGQPVNIDGTNFYYDVRSSLYSSQKAFKPQVGFSIELSKILGVYATAGYNFNFSQNDGLRFVSHSGNFFKDIFPRNKEVNIDATGVNLTVDGKASQELPYQARWFFGVGLRGYLRW